MGLFNAFACLAVSLLVAATPQGAGARGEKEEPETKITVTDNQGTVTEITDPVCVYPKQGLFGEGEEDVEHIRVMHGKGTVKVQFEKISSLTVKKVEGDWIRIEIALKAEEKPQEFKVKNECKLRGQARAFGGEFEIDLSEVKTLVFSEVKPAAEKPSKSSKPSKTSKTSKSSKGG